MKSDSATFKKSQSAAQSADAAPVPHALLMLRPSVWQRFSAYLSQRFSLPQITVMLIVAVTLAIAAIAAGWYAYQQRHQQPLE